MLCKKLLLFFIVSSSVSAVDQCFLISVPRDSNATKQQAESLHTTSDDILPQQSTIQEKSTQPSLQKEQPIPALPVNSSTKNGNLAEKVSTSPSSTVKQKTQKKIVHLLPHYAYISSDSDALPSDITKEKVKDIVQELCSGNPRIDALISVHTPEGFEALITCLRTPEQCEHLDMLATLDLYAKQNKNQDQINTIHKALAQLDKKIRVSEKQYYEISSEFSEKFLDTHKLESAREKFSQEKQAYFYCFKAFLELYTAFAQRLRTKNIFHSFFNPHP